MTVYRNFFPVYYDVNVNNKEMNETTSQQKKIQLVYTIS